MTEAMFTFQAVGLILDAVVFPQDAGTASGPADNRSLMVALLETAQSQVIRPILRRDGISVTDDRTISFICLNRHIAQEIE